MVSLQIVVHGAAAKMRGCSICELERQLLEVQGGLQALRGAMQGVLNGVMQATGCARGELLQAHWCLVQQAEKLQQQEVWLHTRLREEHAVADAADGEDATDLEEDEM